MDLGLVSPMVFPSATGTVRDPSNYRKQWRTAREAIGFEWVTPHVPQDGGHTGGGHGEPGRGVGLPGPLRGGRDPDALPGQGTGGGGHDGGAGWILDGRRRI